MLRDIVNCVGLLENYPGPTLSLRKEFSIWN